LHGAWADGSSEARSYLCFRKEATMSAVQIPLTSLADDVAVTNRVLAMQNGPTILAGHSYGGVVITANCCGS